MDEEDVVSTETDQQIYDEIEGDQDVEDVYDEYEAQDDAEPSFVSGLLQSRPIRILLLSLGAAIICLLLVAIGLNLFKSGHNQPVGVEVYPGATLVTQETQAGFDRRFYSTSDSVQQVLNFYAGRLPKDDINGCKKIYTDKTPSEEPGHYFAQCVVDNSVLDVSQRLSISINYQAEEGTQNFKTFFAIERNWGG
ncbi:MAG: hypothetical protein ABI947_21225 [Chloroflexota bacterium]